MIDNRTTVKALNGQLVALYSHENFYDATLDKEKTVRFFSLLKDVGTLICGLLTEIKHDIMQSICVNSR